MKWIAVSNPQAPLQEYHLISNDTCRVVLKYNQRQQSARVSCDGKYHRLFYIEKTGQLSQKFSFTDQYGMETGSLLMNKWHGEDGTIMLDGNKYNYHLYNDPLTTVSIYETDPLNPVVSCRLNTDNGNPVVALTDNTSGFSNSCFLLGLCWYLFLPVAKENLPEYAIR